MHGLTCPRNQCRDSSLRGNWIRCEGDSVANLKASAGQAEIRWDFPQTEGLKSAIVSYFASTLLEQMGMCRHNLFKAEGMPHAQHFSPQ